MGKWLAVANKSEWINALLKSSDNVSEYGATKPSPVGPLVTVLSETVPEEKFVPRPPDPETGYPCCTKARPCKHWQWDGNKSAYINTLTGKEREAEL